MAKQSTKKTADSERAVASGPGVENLTTAQQFAEVSREALASGASDVTRGEETLRAAAEASVLSDVVFEAGVSDVEQGADMLVASEDIAVQSALVSALSAGDLRRGMEIAGISGELRATADVLGILGMPVVSDFLMDKGEQLQELAVRSLLRFGATRTLAESMAETGANVQSLAENELYEGSVRLEASDALKAGSKRLAKKGAKLTELGEDELVVADGMAESARDLVIEGVTQLVDAK
jgi:hypothetical protein